MSLGVGELNERQQLMNNVLMLAKGAKLFNVPSILTMVATGSFSGFMWPQLFDVFPEQNLIQRTGMNSWDTPAFHDETAASGNRNIIMAEGFGLQYAYVGQR